MARALGGVAAACMVVLFLLLRITEPANYLADDPTSSTLGWKAEGCTIELLSATPPIQGERVLGLVSTSADGSVNLLSRHLPTGAKVFSVYLRSDERTTVRLHAYWPGDGKQSVVRVDDQWRRYYLAVPDYQSGAVWVGIGGLESFSEGKRVEMSAAEVSVGTSALAFQPAHVQDLNWLDYRIEDFRLRTVAGLLGWGALLAGACWLLTFAGVRRRFAAGRPRTALVYGGVIAATWFGMEVISLAACVVLATDKMPPVEALRTVWEDGWRERSSPQVAVADAATTTFSPLTQIRRFVDPSESAGRSRLGLTVNRLGLVDNDAPSAKWEVMPGKPPGMIRVILYGGSTAMGIGARDGTETLSAQLERMLNARAVPGTVFQVLNFGHGAAQSYTTLQFMSSMGSYLKPDVSIELDGFNDAFFATESDLLTHDLPYVINWARYSYYFTNSFNGLGQRPWPRWSLLPFSSQLVGRLSDDEEARSSRIKAYYDEMPMRVLSKWLDETGTSRATALAHNLRFIAGYFVHRDEYLMSYLQPHPWQFRTLMTAPIANAASEEARVKELVAHGAALPLEEYRKRMIDMFTAYAAVYADLAREYRDFPNIRFYDIRDLYQDFPQPAYVDIIHYTPAAQKWMAERMYRDLETVPVVREHLLRDQQGAGGPSEDERRLRRP